MRELRVQTGDICLAVYCHGNASNPTVILVHGYPDSSRVWDAVVERLATQFHVVTYDVRGTGASDVPKRVADYRLAILAKDLEAVANAACPDRAFHLVGHDWGSMQSWESVTAEHMQNRIASFTSISGPCLDHAGMWMRRRITHPTPRNLLQFFGQLFRSWYMLMFQLPLLPELYWRLAGRHWPKYLKTTESITVEPSPTQIKDGCNGVNLYRANILRRLLFPRERRTNVPVQFIVPTRDPYASVALFDEPPRWISRLSRHDVNAAHWIPLSHPELVADFVTRFITAARHTENNSAPIPA